MRCESSLQSFEPRGYLRRCDYPLIETLFLNGQLAPHSAPIRQPFRPDGESLERISQPPVRRRQMSRSVARPKECSCRVNRKRRERENLSARTEMPQGAQVLDQPHCNLSNRAAVELRLRNWRQLR